MMSVLKNIIQVIVSPRDGWESINISDTRTEDLISKVFYPMLAVLAVSEFAPVLYDHTLTISTLLVNALATFAAYFFTFFINVQVMSLAFPEAARTRVAVDRLTDFTIYSLILLIIIEIISNLLPTDFMPITALAFLYMPLVIYRGMMYLDIKGVHSLWATVLATLLLVGLPQLIIKLVLMVIIVEH